MVKNQNSQMGREPCCDKSGLKKGPWTSEEDHKLLDYIHKHGLGSWRALPPKAGLQRCGKSCRLRWTNYLRPDIKRGKFTSQEEQSIIQLHALLGNRWSAIATHLPQRTDNEIKNYWNTHLKKKLTKMGIDPLTHKPINTQQITSSSPSPPLPFPDGRAIVGVGVAAATTLSHMAQWETARLEAEARLAHQSKLKSHSSSSSSQIQNPIGFNDKSVPIISEFVNCWDNKELKENTKSDYKNEAKPEAADHELSLLMSFEAENVSGEDDFADVLLIGTAESENGVVNDRNKDYWDTFLREFQI